ncbi:MAG: DNA-3-methyladenine glycosylase [Dermabacter sp.]|nr:DNA-3-methyladenine glycosylase [Dermabacter sp.]
MTEPGSTPLDPDPLVAARQLLGSILHGRGASALITEVEAYAGTTDPASHAFRGLDRRNAVMFGPPGHLYTYQMHGHTCANIVCSPEGDARAVLLRAGRIVAGQELMAERRPGRRDREWARGPGNLTRALGITMADADTPVFEPSSPIWLELRDLTPEPRNGVEPLISTGLHISTGPRVGVSRAADEPYRLWLTGDPTVSAYRRSPAAPPRIG